MMSHQIEDINKKIETLKKGIEFRSIILENKNSLERLNCRFKQVQGEVNVLEDRSVDII